MNDPKLELLVDTMLESSHSQNRELFRIELLQFANEAQRIILLELSNKE